MTQTDQELDRIERSIDIDASAEKVWSLIEQPGWWINEHEVEPDTRAPRRGRRRDVRRPREVGGVPDRHGGERPRRATCATAGSSPTGDGRHDGRVLGRGPARAACSLRVVESDILSLGKTHDELREVPRRQLRGLGARAGRGRALRHPGRHVSRRPHAGVRRAGRRHPLGDPVPAGRGAGVRVGTGPRAPGQPAGHRQAPRGAAPARAWSSPSGRAASWSSAPSAAGSTTSPTSSSGSAPPGTPAWPGSSGWPKRAERAGRR